MQYFLVALLSSVPVISSACGGGSQFNLYSFWPLIQGIGFFVDNTGYSFFSSYSTVSKISNEG